MKASISLQSKSRTALEVAEGISLLDFKFPTTVTVSSKKPDMRLKVNGNWKEIFGFGKFENIAKIEHAEIHYVYGSGKTPTRIFIRGERKCLMDCGGSELKEYAGMKSFVYFGDIEFDKDIFTEFKDVIFSGYSLDCSCLLIIGDSNDGWSKSFALKSKTDVYLNLDSDIYAYVPDFALFTTIY